MTVEQKLGTIMKELINFSLPLILSGILQQLYNWADAFIVGNIDGEQSLSAIGATTPINFFITIITGFTLGLSVLIAKHFGAKNKIISRRYYLYLLLFLEVCFYLLQ